MTIKTADEYKNEFATIAGNIGIAYNHYRSGKGTLSALGVGTPSYYDTLGEAILKGFLSHVKTICTETSKEFQGNTTESFNYGCLEFMGLELPRSISGCDTRKHSDEFIVSEILSHFDYDKFVSELIRLSGNLENKGKESIAKSLLSVFRLGKDTYINYVPKRTARHISVDGSHYQSYGSYFHSDKQYYHDLAQNIAALAEELDTPAFVGPFYKLIEQVNNTDDGVLPSGTTFGCKSTVLIKVFNGHIRYSFTPEMLSTLITYIRIYAPEKTLCDIPKAA